MEQKKVGASLLGSAILAALSLPGCGGSDSGGGGTSSAPDAVQKVSLCNVIDSPEVALQGQVPAAMRAEGFKGFNCNLVLAGQSKGEGASWQHAFFTDAAGHRCSYYDTASPVDGTANRQHLGVVVLDTTDRTHPTPTAYLNSVSMMDPWESLKVQQSRQMLIAENGTNAAGGPELDLYDISQDCRFPQLLSSVATGTVANGDAAALPAGEILKGHEGNVSPDGLTWYSGDRGTPKKYTATDISDKLHPVLIATWTLPQIYPPNWSVTTHGLTVSEDGTRAYVSQAGVPQVASIDASQAPVNGILILDTSEVQARLPGAQIKQLGSVFWIDGAQAQHNIQITISGKNYLVGVDELGSGGGNGTANATAACKAGLALFPMARIIDISNESNPTIVSRLALETHDPANCDAVIPDIAGLGSFTYGSHYCSVDNKHAATTLACGYFNSGIRVFDIRDPAHPKEIAYYNPPAATSPMFGSNHFNPQATVKSNTPAGGPDWCTAQIRLDATAGTLETTCQDNGFLSLKFEGDVWPFPESSTPPGLQN